MKRNNMKIYLILGIFFALISIVAFVIQKEKNTTFWIVYVFTGIAFAAQAGIWKTTLGKDEVLKRKFLGLPMIHIGIVYLIIQIVTFAVYVFVPTLPVWSAIIVCALIIGLFLICVIADSIGQNEILQVEEKVQRKVCYIKELQVNIELLAGNEADKEIKNALILLGEKISFSDPMSDERLAYLENEISDKIIELKTATNKAEIISKINLLLDERNKKCKILK